MTISFNGETTLVGRLQIESLADTLTGRINGSSAQLARDAKDAAESVRDALEELSTISSVGVTASGTVNATSKEVTLSFDVHFHYGPLVTSPLNLGGLPLMTLGVQSLAGLKHSSVAHQQLGLPPVNFSFPEQAIEINATSDLVSSLSGNLLLDFDGEQTVPLPFNASERRPTANEVREALMGLPTIGECEVFRYDYDDGSGGIYGMKWLVRFYAEGDPPHMGKQPSILVNTSQLTEGGSGGGEGRRLLGGLSLTIGVETTSEGETPFSPIDEDALTIVDDFETDPNATNDANAISYSPPVHICGNGIRSTAEVCDDNNTAGADGCDSLCRVEYGWQCTSSNTEGSGVGGLDTCVPICGDGIRILWSASEQCTRRGDEPSGLVAPPAPLLLACHSSPLTTPLLASPCMGKVTTTGPPRAMAAAPPARSSPDSSARAAPSAAATAASLCAATACASAMRSATTATP